MPVNTLADGALREIERLRDSITELESTHQKHLAALVATHRQETEELQRKHATLLAETATLHQQVTHYEETIEGMRVEVQMVRQSFDLVQTRLRRVLIDQDDLVRIIQLLDREIVAQRMNGGKCDKGDANDTSDTSDAKTPSVTAPNDSLSGSAAQTEQLLHELETRGSEPVRRAIKYFRKLQAADPMHLARLLDISFAPDRSFVLSNSLLASILVHMNGGGRDDKSKLRGSVESMRGDAETDMFRVLLEEIVRLRRDINDLALVHVEQRTDGEQTAAITPRSDAGGVVQWILSQDANDKNGGLGEWSNPLPLLTSFLSRLTSQ